MNILSQIGQTIVGVAPTIAGLFGGPLASAGVTELEKVLGVTPAAGASVQDRAATLQGMLGGMTADQIVAVKQADDALKQKMVDAGVQLAQVDAGDRASARTRQIETKDRTPAHLAYILIGGFIGIAVAQLAALMGWPEEAAKIPAQGWVIIGNISGYLASEAKAAATYFFGSNSSSAQKNDLISKALDSTPPGDKS